MRRWVGISLSKYFFWVLVLSFGFGGSAAWAPATAADMTPETQALFQAVRTGNLDVVERSMLAGADVNRENDQGKTAVELAIDRSNFKIAHYLLIWRSNLGERRSRRVFQPPQAYYQEAPVQEASPQPVVVAPTPKPVVVMESPPPAPKQSPPPEIPTQMEPAAVAEPKPAPVETAIIPKPVVATEPTPAAKQSPPEIPTQMEPAAVAEPKPAPVETATVTSDPAPATEPPPTTDSGPDMMDKITEFFSSKPEETKPPPEMEQAAVPEPEPAPVSVPEPAPAPVETPIAKPEPLPPPQPVTATDSGSDMMDKITEFFSSRAEETKLPPETEQAAVPEPEPEPAPISVPEPAPAPVKVPVAKPEPPPPHQPVPATGIAQATPVAAVAKAAAPKQRIDPVLGRSLRLGKPMAAAHAEGCLEEKPQLFWICIEPVDWPKEIAEVFQVRSSLYQGAQAIVRYEGGGVSQIHSLFPARFFDAVSAYFSGRLGIPGTQVDNWASMPGEPNSNNRTLLWLGPKAIILEIRQFDDLSRPSIPDTKHGVVRIYGLNSNPVLEDVSWSDFILMRNSVQKIV